MPSPGSLPVPADTASLGNWALYYAEAFGFPVFPCAGKVPLIAGGHGCLDATLDAAQIRAWWSASPTANIGIATSAYGFVLDVDPRHHGDDTLADLERQYGPLPPTLTALTGGADRGAHYYFTSADPIPNTRLQGIEVQCQGKYVIAPPSVHPDTGRTYQWDSAYGPWDVVPQPAPPWLITVLTHAAAPARPAAGPHASGSDVIPDGARDDTLAQMIIEMSRMGMSEAAARAAIAIENTTRCHPPMTPDELERVFKQKFLKYPAHPVLDLPPAMPSANGTGAMPHGSNGSGSGTLPSWTTSPQLKTLVFHDAADTLTKKHPLPQWLIKGLIPEGLTCLFGSPKSSKTYLAYGLSLALVQSVTNGHRWLDHYDIANPGPVVYFSLEDDEDDSYFRIKELAPGLTTLPRNQFFFVHGVDVPSFEEGLVTILHEQCIEPLKPTLIVIDPISYLFGATKKGTDQFTEIKNALLPLHWLGKHHHLSILTVDHRRKKSAEDVDIFETMYGSNAKLAVADSLLAIVRDDKDVTLHAKVRKGSDQTLNLGFEFATDGTAHWSWKGTSSGLLDPGQLASLSMQILLTLGSEGRPLSVDDLLIALQAASTPTNRNSLKSALWRMVKKGEISKTTRGQYVSNGGTP